MSTETTEQTLGYRDNAKPEEIPFKFHIVYTYNIDDHKAIVHEEFDSQPEMNERIVKLVSGKAFVKKYSSITEKETKYFFTAEVSHTFFGQYKEIEIKTERYVTYKK